ncbi:MAG: YkgJ family cysteine cluster protein [Candidatus Omnitrophica bacterium]|nr:YkgJ family cysteine cluster protein [Candidatus Omnitrophota bacterium]
MPVSFWGWCQSRLHLSFGGALWEKSQRMKAVYRSLDQATARFKSASGLNCPSPCGLCCLHSTVEASELEMLPAAFALARVGKVDEWYDRAKAGGFTGLCVFFSKEQSGGQCLFYEYRPLVCRLFGYAGNKDKHERPRLVTCRVFKEIRPVQTELVLEKVGKGTIVPPMMSDFVMRAAMVDPAMTRESYPVNLALKKALERVSINQRFNRKT